MLFLLFFFVKGFRLNPLYFTTTFSYYINFTVYGATQNGVCCLQYVVQKWPHFYETCDFFTKIILKNDNDGKQKIKLSFRTDILSTRNDIHNLMFKLTRIIPFSNCNAFGRNMSVCHNNNFKLCIYLTKKK